MLTSWLTLSLIIINYSKLKVVILYFWGTKTIFTLKKNLILFLSNLSMDCFIFNISFQREIFWNIFRDCSVCFDWVKVLVIKVDTHQNSCPLFIFVNEAGSSGNVIFSLHKQISLLISKSHFEWQNLARIRTRQWSFSSNVARFLRNWPLNLLLKYFH